MPGKIAGWHVAETEEGVSYMHAPGLDRKAAYSEHDRWEHDDAVFGVSVEQVDSEMTPSHLDKEPPKYIIHYWGEGNAEDIIGTASTLDEARDMARDWIRKRPHALVAWKEVNENRWEHRETSTVVSRVDHKVTKKTAAGDSITFQLYTPIRNQDGTIQNKMSKEELIEATRSYLRHDGSSGLDRVHELIRDIDIVD